MTYIVNMASGDPCPDDEPVVPQKHGAQRRHREAILSGTAYTQLQQVTPQLTHIDRNAAAIAAGLNIAALIRSLKD